MFSGQVCPEFSDLCSYKESSNSRKKNFRIASNIIIIKQSSEEQSSSSVDIFCYSINLLLYKLWLPDYKLEVDIFLDLVSGKKEKQM